MRCITNRGASILLRLDLAQPRRSAQFGRSNDADEGFPWRSFPQRSLSECTLSPDPTNIAQVPFAAQPLKPGHPDDERVPYVESRCEGALRFRCPGCYRGARLNRSLDAPLKDATLMQSRSPRSFVSRKDCRSREDEADYRLPAAPSCKQPEPTRPAGKMSETSPAR